MTSMAESTAAKEPEAKRNEGISSPRTQEPASEQESGLFSRALSGAPGEPALSSIVPLLGNPLFSHSANNGQRVIALKRVQETYGNRVAQRAVAGIQRKPANSRMVQRQCACGGSCRSCQATVSVPTSQAVEASQLFTIPVQAKVKSDSTGAESVNNNLTMPEGQGEALAEEPRTHMESRFGHDFRDVRIHTDEGASAAAEALNSNAFTSGRDIYFARGRYAPDSLEGQRLLAHELVHTIQQANQPSIAHKSASTSDLIIDPNKSLEQDADRVAEQVVSSDPNEAMGRGAPSEQEKVHLNFLSTPRIQRFSGPSNRQMDAAPATVDQALASPGRPLEPTLRQDMERRFGHDFNGVRLHTDALAAQSARDISALAYTHGTDIVFGTGQFAPDTVSGRRLLAHELAHVVQQQGAGPGRAPKHAGSVAPGPLIQRQCGGRPMPPCPTEWVSQPSSSGIGSAFGQWLGLQYRASHTLNSYLLVDWWVYSSRGKIGTISGSRPGGRQATGLADIDPAVLNALQATPEWARSRTNRTDILASDTDEVFEIKPIRGAGTGPAQLAGYLMSLRAVAPTAPSWMGGRARDWKPGRWDPEPHLFPVPVSLTGFCVICTWADPANAGVLVYDLLCCDNREPPEEKEPKDKEPPEQGPGSSPNLIPSLPELMKLGAKVWALLKADGLLSAALSLVGPFLAALTPFLALAALAVGIVFLWDKIKSFAHMIAGAAKFVWDKVSAVVALVRDTLKEIGIKIGELAVFVGGLIKDIAEMIAEGLLRAGRAIISGAKWLGGKIADGAEAVWDWLVGSDIEPMIPNVELPLTEERTMHCATVAREDALIQMNSDLLFPFGKWKLEDMGKDNDTDKAKAEAVLKDAAAKVLSTPRTSDDPIRFLGYTDVIGEDVDNERLSKLRAEAVADWFVEHGVIPRSKVQITGFGETQAQAKANDDEGRKKDRRVDILVKKSGSAEQRCW